MGSATTDRRLGLAGNTAFKAPVDCATTANILLSGEQTIDGVATSASRVLVKNQTDATTNGLYDSSTASWTRCIDANGNYDLTTGTLVLVAGGSTLAASIWELTSAKPVTVGTSALTFALNFTTAAVSAYIQTLLPAANAAAARAILGGMMIAQMLTSVTGAVATGTTLIPVDDTVPQSTEGDQYLSLTITPKSAASTLEIDVVLYVSSNQPSTSLTAALFQDAAANALATTEIFQTTANARGILTLKHVMPAGTTSATTFKVRAGASVAGTLTLNGFAGNRLFGGVANTRITVKEITT